MALTVAFWGFGLPAIMNPENAIAVRAEVVEETSTSGLEAFAPSVEIDNANLYFSCWIAFGCAVFCEFCFYIIEERLCNGLHVLQN